MHAVRCRKKPRPARLYHLYRVEGLQHKEVYARLISKDAVPNRLAAPLPTCTTHYFAYAQCLLREQHDLTTEAEVLLGAAATASCGEMDGERGRGRPPGTAGLE